MRLKISLSLVARIINDSISLSCSTYYSIIYNYLKGNNFTLSIFKGTFLHVYTKYCEINDYFQRIDNLVATGDTKVLAKRKTATIRSNILKLES